jgi:hypothetical protein
VQPGVNRAKYVLVAITCARSKAKTIALARAPHSGFAGEDFASRAQRYRRSGSPTLILNNAFDEHLSIIFR